MYRTTIRTVCRPPPRPLTHTGSARLSPEKRRAEQNETCEGGRDKRRRQEAEAEAEAETETHTAQGVDRKVKV